MRKIHGSITAASTDTEIKTKPNAPRSLATEILTHRKFVKLQYITPFTIAGKILLQQSWKDSNDWDAPFAGHLQERTQQWGI